MNSEYRMQQGSSWDSGNLTGMSQKQLLQYITEMGFAVDDLVLYLDTHENDCEAIKLCNMYGKLYAKAREIYDKKYMPLTAEADENGSSWRWVQGPWPWQGGIC